MSINLNKIHIPGHLTEEYEHQQDLYSLQMTNIQRFLDAQGKHLAESIFDSSTQVRFDLPDRVVCTLEHVDSPVLVTIPKDQRTYTVGSFLSHLRKEPLYKQLRHVLNELEQSPDRVVSVASSLVRHATVLHMVNNSLPSGRKVNYRPADDEETLATMPEKTDDESPDALAAASDSIVEEDKASKEAEALLMTYVPYARLFYLPQLVAFGEKGELLVKPIEEAEAVIHALQSFMEVLFKAVALAPYIPADDEYARKRFSLLGQLVNQGRALAIFQTKVIITIIRKRAESGSLNRGLRISLPYFDDQDLQIKETNIEVIPAGLIMFVPAFVVRAVQQEAMKVSQDTRYNSSTRKHLMYLLTLLENAFDCESKS